MIIEVSNGMVELTRDCSISFRVLIAVTFVNFKWLVSQIHLLFLQLDR